MTEETWSDKYNKWRTSPEKHWAWRNKVAKFLRDKVSEEEKEKSTKFDMKDFQ